LKRVCSPSGELSAEFRATGDVWPGLRVRRSSYPENVVKLVDFAVSREQGCVCSHLEEDATSTPHIDRVGIDVVVVLLICVSSAHDHLWCSIPKRNNLMCQLLDGEAVLSTKSEVAELEFSSGWVCQEVLRLQVAMEDTIAMTGEVTGGSFRYTRW